MKRHLVHIYCLIFCCYLSLTVTGQLNNSIFSGGSNDGFTSGCIGQSTSSAIFNGSSGDGHDLSCFAVTVSNDLFSGGIGDGYSERCYSSMTNSAIFSGGSGDGHSIDCGYFMDDCVVFNTAPVDLSKSFDPVNGVKDRVQLKWYKASPEIRYSDADAAMCDIKFWKKRFLDPPTGNPIGPVIENPDTVLLADVKKTYPDNSPREIFKWPVKYRADGVNNSNRAEPNFRYEWKVRCECGHDGTGPESPWSDIKLFNTPDFDPVTGIYTPPAGQEDLGLDKILSEEEMNIRLFPNPTDGSKLFIQHEEVLEGIWRLRISDMTGRVFYEEQFNSDKDEIYELNLSGSRLSQGIYFLEFSIGKVSSQEIFIVQ